MKTNKKLTRFSLPVLQRYFVFLTLIITVCTLGPPLEMEFQLQPDAQKKYYYYTVRAKRRDDFTSKSLDEHLNGTDSITSFARIFLRAISKFFFSQLQ